MPDDLIESREFPAPFVRVRGRLSRTGEVRWSPCLRTQKGGFAPKGRKGLENEKVDEKDPSTMLNPENQYTIDFLDYCGNVLVSKTTEPLFFAKNQEWATFVARLPYHDQTQAVRLRQGAKELGVLCVPVDTPCFTLLCPGKDSCIDGCGILHLRWARHCSLHPLTFFVRYSHNGCDWVRPGVNLCTNDYYLDLRQMPGGERCCVQVIATNGYRTSYVQTRHFEVPVKPPEILLGDTSGPVLFAQGFSLEHGPIVDDNIKWLIDDGAVVQHGGTLDVRKLASSIPTALGAEMMSSTHRICVQVCDPDGAKRIAVLGTYDLGTGLSISPAPL